ncbi:putative FAD-linked oxidoreductase [Gemmata sp. SH-PL17]|uniref:FAD-binding oxidoreductase n=1 Tax=Gemmata sp. SH-PL17 TaxID=1630693 RepID=UPI00078E12CD|nr:FAD-linked oxidase C-terminal domain-containing protein [Gemmata sp. SH-PL17]AMV26925.1 putative FAD-linked oxidoreductase [Gemmata sp. SH-PL17]
MIATSPTASTAISAADHVKLVSRMKAIVGNDNVLTAAADMAAYECDGFTIAKTKPNVVVFPTSTEHIVGIVKACNELGVSFLARGAGTSLAGGCVLVGGGVMIALARMKRILEVNVRDRYAVVEPGVVNVWLTNALKPHGLHYAPDPSSQGACTIGGNVATNSGGPHTLKYGVTVNHILGVELVLPDGRVVTCGGPTEDGTGYDLTGAIAGSEGTFGVVSKVWVRLTKNPEAYRTLLGIFETIDDATSTISDIIGAGIVPAALELLDKTMLSAVEAAFKFGFPLDAEAVVIMEVDGLAAGLQDEADRIEVIAKKNRAREVRKANTEAERLALWKARKQAFGTIGRLGYPSYCTQDGVVPRTKLPEIMRHIQATAKKYGLGICNVFHAGDGNVHPILMFDERDPAQVQKVLDASHEILAECINLGGSVTGEHGIGVEKIDFMPLMFTPDDLHYMVRLRTAFNPDGRCSPGKLLPTAGGCSEPSIGVTQTKPARRAAV